jgi:hypothetical protein
MLARRKRRLGKCCPFCKKLTAACGETRWPWRTSRKSIGRSA